MTGIMASAIPEAISPYSMAVAAESSLRKAMSVRRIRALYCRASKASVKALITN